MEEATESHQIINMEEATKLHLGINMEYDYDLSDDLANGVDSVVEYQSGMNSRPRKPMTAILPNPFALKANNNCRYLNCVRCANINKKGVLKFCKEDCDSNFRIENAQTPGYVHIKCVATGKFLRRAPNQDGQLLMIRAIANTPNEDKTDEGCTLFHPVNVGPNTNRKVICRIVHVQSRLYIRPHYTKGEDAILCAVNRNPDPSRVDLLTAVGQR